MAWYMSLVNSFNHNLVPPEGLMRVVIEIWSIFVIGRASDAWREKKFGKDAEEE